jgi:hypothetical protein
VFSFVVLEICTSAVATVVTYSVEQKLFIHSTDKMFLGSVSLMGDPNDSDRDSPRNVRNF